MEKVLKQVMDEVTKKFGDNPAEIDRRRKEGFMPTQKLKLVRDGSIKFDAPKAPITTPARCLSIFRTFLEGADKEILALLSLTMQNEYLNCSAVAFGTISHVVVHPREVFKYALARDNAAKFVLCHNHPSGNAAPSPEDMNLMEDIQDLGNRLGCRMVDFLIIGDGNETYFSYRENNYD